MLGAVGLLAVALGWIVVRFDGFEAEIGPAILLTAAGVGSLALIMTGPIACLAAIAALTVAGIQPQLAEIGGVEATLVDVFYLGLVGWWLRDVIGRAQHPDPGPRPASRLRTEDRDRPLRLRLSHLLSRCRLESRRPFRLDRLLAATGGHALDRLPGRKRDRDRARRADRARRDRPRRGRRSGLRSGQRRRAPGRPGRRRPGAQCARPRVRATCS